MPKKRKMNEVIVKMIAFLKKINFFKIFPPKIKKYDKMFEIGKVDSSTPCQIILKRR